MSVTEIIIRILISFFVLLLMTRIMGRKEVRQLTFFNFVSGIAIGSIAATLATNQSLSIWQGIMALVFWALLTVIMGFIDIKAGTNIRTLLNGEPATLIKQGKLMDKELRRLRLDVNDLRALLRQKSIFSINDVNYAIMETDGNISVLKKDPKKTVTKSDMRLQKVKTDVYPIPTIIINDGEIIEQNLADLNLSKEWVTEQLEQAGIPSLSSVFYAELQTDGTLYIDQREDL
ncbi:YetF domain-containing protein [Oceanobacillus halotolerans]|uniref:YetF domain-containing protein n=1 Tax=Oceanobacillus halotolerans TaxID=2663380 RepID=UPI0013D97818|nr:DUF421 domain-containing protein [Oceanobacillus halotolerans]